MAACTAAVLTAGCGVSERQMIPFQTAQALAVQSDRVAEALERGDRCEADRLATELVADARSASVPAGYRTPLLDTAGSLSDRIECPQPAPPPAEEEEDGNGKGEGGDDEGGGDEGKGKGKGKGGHD
jgi:hypothetical protein